VDGFWMDRTPVTNEQFQRFELEVTGAPDIPHGTIHRVTVDVSGEHIQDAEAELRRAMARQ
jgi:formylglycine-generating enzyme required for sulfatase activity